MSDSISKDDFFRLMKVNKDLQEITEQQQKVIGKQQEIVTKQQQQMEQLQKQLPMIASQTFKQALNDVKSSIQGDLKNQANQTAKELEKATKGAIQATKAITEHEQKITLKYTAIPIVTAIILYAVVFIFAKAFIPSFDEIQERRETMDKINNAGGVFQIGDCGGELCVRVNPKKCGQGKTKDYCVVDLK